MSLWKVIVVASLCTLALFIGLLVYALYPTIRNVSDHRQLSRFVEQDLTLKKDVFIYVMEEGQYRFEPLLMSADRHFPYEKKLILPEGSVVRFEKFKTYTNSAGSGLTELYGIGRATSPSGKIVRFEYDWGNLDNATILPRAPWQNESEEPVRISVKNNLP